MTLAPNVGHTRIQGYHQEGTSRMQGLFVLYARVGSGDPVRVLRLFHNKYAGYCCIHLLSRTTYNLSLPRLCANYNTGCLRLCNSGLLTRANVHWSVSRSQLPTRYCTVPVWNGTIRDRSVLPLPGILWGKLSANYHVICIIYIIYMTRLMSYFNMVGKLGSTVGEC